MRDLKEFTVEHLIEAIDQQLEDLYNQSAEAEEVHNQSRIALSGLEEAIYNLEKQRRELMIDG